MDALTDTTLRAVADHLNEMFNGEAEGDDIKVGFALLMFPLGDSAGKRPCNFVSNVNRKDILVALKEMVATFEGRAEISGVVQ